MLFTQDAVRWLLTDTHGVLLSLGVDDKLTEFLLDKLCENISVEK